MTAESEETEVRFVAIGDSFTEGVGDELPDGAVRGWADLTAAGWADATGRTIRYANLAIRGKLVRPIVDEQLEAALALRPTHLSFNGGGNDMLRPRTSIEDIVGAFLQVMRRCDEEGVRLILLSGANPSAQLPLGGLIHRRGDALSDAVVDRIADRDDIVRALNWYDRTLTHPSYWSTDRLHMNARGHHRVAARVLQALGIEAPGEWWSLPVETQTAVLARGEYFREHLAPWVRRRLTGRSSGDDRDPKFGSWVEVAARS
ncbi:SGNH/GDSL hydrolase family protein [Microbacterium sp. cf332]|uniref:SGNH/GDSL hydrolase family protein n=1 Tax=Microbacterium sp. cf332 TaxID=1761804 RepID=UPI000882ED59|nr:SGNH/GDSL hydrolase family protein [Microbacterium sp. cf332]SDQ07892.1 Lysophospholipase L1 [Microbacterium sp. cf332]